MLEFSRRRASRQFLFSWPHCETIVELVARERLAIIQQLKGVRAKPSAVAIRKLARLLHIAGPRAYSAQRGICRRNSLENSAGIIARRRTAGWDSARPDHV